MYTLLVNGADITTYGFAVLKRNINPPVFEVFGQEWPRNRPYPILGVKKPTYIPIDISLYHSGTVQDFEEDRSKLMQALQTCTLKFSDLTFYFDCDLETGEDVQKFIFSMREFKLNFKCYLKYTAEVTKTANDKLADTIVNGGNLESGAVITITPSTDMTDFTITIEGDSFDLSDLTTATPVVIDGVNMTVMEGAVNKFADYEALGFPVIYPGTNDLTFSADTCDVQIKYKPRWL